MINAIIIMAVALLGFMAGGFYLIDVNNKLDKTNEDLMEENEALREKLRGEANYD